MVWVVVSWLPGHNLLCDGISVRLGVGLYRSLCLLGPSRIVAQEKGLQKRDKGEKGLPISCDHSKVAGQKCNVSNGMLVKTLHYILHLLFSLIEIFINTFIIMKL